MPLEAIRGSKFLELLSTNNKKMIDQWNILSSVKKEYDTLLKTYVYNVGGKSPVAQMSFPKNKKQKLNLYFPLLVLQLCFPVKANLLCDIGVTTSNNQRKRITLSSNQKSMHKSSLFTAVPLSIENCNKWINILVDVEEIVSTVWENLTLREINFMSFSGVFRLKRVFLLTKDLVDSADGVFTVKYDQLPRDLTLPKNIEQLHIYISSSTSLVKQLNSVCLENEEEDVFETTSSRCSSRSTLHEERIHKVKTLALSASDQSLSLPELLEDQNINTEFPLLNLSLLSFSGERDSKIQKETDAYIILPERESKESNLQKNDQKELNYCSNEFSTDIWMPLNYKNIKNDS